MKTNKQTRMNIDRRQLAAYAVVVVFMAVTVGHVAIYTGSFEPGGWQLLGWFYALGVDASILVCAWLTKWKTTSRWAWVGYISFVTASGALNVAQVAPTSAGAWVYAIFPTAAQALLGFLARDAGGFRTGSRDTDKEKHELHTEVKHLRSELTQAHSELTQVRSELTQPHELPAPDFEQFERMYAGLDGKRTGLTASRANVELVRAGFAPISESTVRGWLERVRDV